MISENQDPSQLGLRLLIKIFKSIGWLPSNQPRFKGSLELLKGALFGPKGTLTGSDGAFLSEIASERHFSLFGRNLRMRTQKCVGNVSPKLQMA